MLSMLSTGEPDNLAGTFPLSRSNQFQTVSITAPDSPVQIELQKVSARTRLESITVLAFIKCDVLGSLSFLASQHWSCVGLTV